MELSDVDLLDPDTFRLGRHHEMFEAIRAQDPVYWSDEPDGGGFWSITRHEDLIAVNRDAHVFSSAEKGISIADIPPEGDMVREMMLYMDPPRHTRYRLLVNKGFTPRMIGLLETHLTAKATAIVDNVADAGRCDFVADVAAELPLQAIAELMGVPQEDRRKLFDWSNRMIGADDPSSRRTPRAMEAASDAATELFMYSHSLAELRRDEPQDDIISRLLGAEIEGDKLSEMEFDMFFMLLAVAGNETTRNATAHGMKALHRAPRAVRQAQGRPRRCCPAPSRRSCGGRTPVMHFRRTALEDYEIGGKQIRKPATRSSCGTSRPTVTRPCSTTRSASTSSVRPTSTSRSAAAARTSASAPTWPAWSCA